MSDDYGCLPEACQTSFRVTGTSDVPKQDTIDTLAMKILKLRNEMDVAFYTKSQDCSRRFVAL